MGKIIGAGQKLYQNAKKIIPGGTQLLSKRPEMFLPKFWPAYYQKAAGCEVWDLDGKKYIDMSYMGIGACVLGYTDPDVNQAVKEAIDKGVATTLNCPEEVKLAEILLQLHPWAQQIRFAKTGGEAMAIAVRIARAYTSRDKVLFCGYHGWHDWYLSANLADSEALDGHLLPGLEPKGVPRGLKGTTMPFEYNDLQTFLKLFKEHEKELAAVIMEPVRNHLPHRGFLEAIRERTEKSGIVLIMDEISSGFRMITGGAHLKFGIKPDIAVFAKALGNGFPIAAIIGKREVMQAAQTSFISSTMWTEKVGFVSALAMIKKFRQKNVADYICKMAIKVQKGWKNTAKKTSLEIEVSGVPPYGHFEFKYNEPLVLKTLFTQEMLKRGFLASNVYYGSYAHKDIHLQKYLKACGEVFAFIKKAVEGGHPKKYLKGPVAQTGFQRLT